MKRGDVCVQRGTIHGWKNPTDQPARIYFVLIGTTHGFTYPAMFIESYSVDLMTLLMLHPTAAEPVEIDGKPFEKTGFSDKEVTTGGK